MGFNNTNAFISFYPGELYIYMLLQVCLEYELMIIKLQENNRSELERLDRERQNDFLNMLKGFVYNQVCSNNDFNVF